MEKTEKAKAIRAAKATRQENFKRLVSIRMRKQPPAVKLVIYSTQFLYYATISKVMNISNLFHVSRSSSDRIR